MTYEIVFYKAGIRTGGYNVAEAKMAADEFVGCVERYTKVAGFYIESFNADGCSVVDLSDEAMTIKLIGVISDDIKDVVKKKFDLFKDCK